jgi:hypothetical protein
MCKQPVMSHAHVEAVQVVLHAAATDDVVRSVELYQGISGEADKFNSVISMLLWRPK